MMSSSHFKKFSLNIHQPGDTSFLYAVRQALNSFILKNRAYHQWINGLASYLARGGSIHVLRLELPTPKRRETGILVAFVLAHLARNKEYPKTNWLIRSLRRYKEFLLLTLPGRKSAVPQPFQPQLYFGDAAWLIKSPHTLG